MFGLAAFAVLLLGMLWGAVLFKVRAEQEVEIANAMKHTANLARAFEEDTAHTLREADQVLLFILEMYREQGKKIDLRRLIEDGPIARRIFTDFVILDEDGAAAASSQPLQPGSLASQEMFQVHAAANLSGLVVGKPRVDPRSGKSSFQISRRIDNLNRTFGGVLVATIDPSHFSRLYGQVDLGKAGLVSLNGLDDAIVRVRYPGGESLAGRDASKGTLHARVKTEKNGSFIAASPIDGVRRILSYRSLPDYGLVLIVGVSEDEALAAFHQRRRDYNLAALLMSAAILVMTAILMVLTSRQRRMTRDLSLRNIDLLRTEEAARSGEQRARQLATIVATSRDAIISRDTEGTILTWNPAAEGLFGWSAKEAVGRKIWILVPPGREDEVRGNMERLHRGRNLVAYDTSALRKDGRIIDISLTQSPIKGESGEVTAVSLIFRDIGERKRGETERAQLAAIVENSNDAIISRSLDGTFLSWNKGAERMFGYTAAEAIGQPATLIVLAEDREDVARKIEDTLRGRAPASYETRRITRDGRIIEVEASISPIRSEDGKISAVSIIFHDISERKLAQKQISFLSQYDTLTGLPNRVLFRDRLELAMVRARRQREIAGVMLFDLDRFRQVNEDLGLEAGDELLRRVAVRLKDTLRDVDTIARLGADEFAILVEGMGEPADITAVGEKLIVAFAMPFEVMSHEVVVVPSIGITLYPNGSNDSQKLLEHAEMAMNRVKREGGGGLQLYDAEPVTRSGGRLTIEMQLRHALERGELELHYQPKLRFLDGAITGAEALLRWHLPGIGQISPGKFIPIAEESGLIIPIGEWVLRTACDQMSAWNEREQPIGIAVNLSPRQFRQKNLADAVLAALKRSGLPAGLLELEITEGTAMANAEHAVAVLGNLHGIGVRLSVDDFGTGYSSLSYLKRFPLDSLKIDRSFVLDVGNDPNGEAIVHATIALAKSLKIKVIAEGVETQAQRDFLEDAGCDEMQGYLYSRPLPATEFHALITRSRRQGDGTAANAP
jgi:PAS domain S-box-containing protein/diguanylate cyclase (GGDEF)-like protein